MIGTTKQIIDKHNDVQTDKPVDFKSLQSFTNPPQGAPNGVEPEEFTYEDEFICELPQGTLWNRDRMMCSPKKF